MELYDLSGPRAVLAIAKAHPGNRASDQAAAIFARDHGWNIVEELARLQSIVRGDGAPDSRKYEDLERPPASRFTARAMALLEAIGLDLTPEHLKIVEASLFSAFHEGIDYGVDTKESEDA